MSEHIADQDFSGQEMQSETVSDRIFVGDNFDRAYFGRRRFLRCVFVGCSFRMASLENVAFVRCLFRGNDFCGAFGDDSQFYECHSAQDSFNYFRFERTHFGFITTDGSTFRHADLPEEGPFYPAGSRELIAEIVRKCSDNPKIQGIAGLIQVFDSTCWETLINTLHETFGRMVCAHVWQHLGKYVSLRPVLAKWAPLVSNNQEE